MLRNVKEMRGYSIQATDGEIGKVHAFYFDDQTWVIRYMVADTGGWLLDRKVFISPAALHRPNWGEEVLPVSLTRKQVKHSPSIDTDKPVSRQHEREILEYYKWPIYWGHMGYPPPVFVRPSVPVEEVKQVEEKAGKKRQKKEIAIFGARGR
jgi:hypothetical protein